MYTEFFREMMACDSIAKRMHSELAMLHYISAGYITFVWTAGWRDELGAAVMMGERMMKRRTVSEQLEFYLAYLGYSFCFANKMTDPKCCMH